MRRGEADDDDEGEQLRARRSIIWQKPVENEVGKRHDDEFQFFTGCENYITCCSGITSRVQDEEET
jgi:hypothetical protein